MRIGVDIRELERDKLTGIGRYTLNFLDYVSRYDRQNEYVLFGNQKTSCPVQGQNLFLRVIPQFHKLYWDQVVLARQAGKEKLDIFFSPYYKCPIAAGVKTVITVHDAYPFFRYEFEPLLKSLLRRQYYKVMFYSADSIITVSQHTKQVMLKVSRLNPDKIKVIYNSVSDEFRVLDKKDCFAKIKALYGIEKEFILYVGNFRPHKNLRRLIQAYNLLAPRLKERYQLAIVAKKDDFFPEFGRLVKEMGLEKNVSFLGLVKEDNLIYFYNAASLYISISLYEGFGLPFIEAMACGLPVIASDITAIPEIVGDAAVLVDPYDVRSVVQAAERLLNEGPLREGLIENGLLRAKMFSVKEQVEKILTVFREV